VKYVGCEWDPGHREYVHVWETGDPAAPVVTLMTARAALEPEMWAEAARVVSAYHAH